MNFSQRQADPRRHLVGLSAVILFHVVLVYFLVTGLAKKVIDVVRAPIETKVIEEIKKPPPPPEVVLPPPPKLEAPPPPYIPPPEVQIAAPPPAPTISVAPSPTPPAPVDIKPQAAVAPAPPAPPAPPAKQVAASIGVYCTGMQPPKMPPKAVREGINGTVRASVVIKGGKVTQVDILSATPRGVFESAVRTAMLQYDCKAAGEGETTATQDFDFKLDN